MKRFLSTLCLAAVLGTQALAGDIGEGQVGDVMIHEGWARASLGNMPNSAAYMMLMTQGDGADKLVAASSPVAEKVELHTHVLEGDVAKMRPVEAIDVTPGEPTVLEPGGLHVMLLGLTEKLEEGASVPLTLTFENAGEITMELPVRGLKGGEHGEGMTMEKHDG